MDQIEELRKLSLEERMQGGTGSMSAMVREAIDAYIAKKRGRWWPRTPSTPRTGSTPSTIIFTSVFLNLKSLPVLQVLPVL